uniref:F-box protein 45 n=1 Tax=Fundulus heteroclitus TaxID=8078 RepID=A0A3Q2QYM5_FUNHE
MLQSGIVGGGRAQSFRGTQTAPGPPALETPGVAGRLPARVLEHIFSYLEMCDLMRCSLVCWHWNSILADENSEVWRSLSARTLSDEALRSDILCNLPTYKGKVGPRTRTSGSCMNCFKTLICLYSGNWSITALNLCYLAFVIFSIMDFFFLVCLHLCNRTPLCAYCRSQIGERIRVILDMDDKTLAFERGFEFLGIAFRGLPKVCLFPAVSAVYGNTEVTMVYLGKPLDG